MHKQVPFIVALLAFAISTPAHAEFFGWLSSGGPEPVVADAPLPMSTPTQSTHIGGGFKHGYPFQSGCCEPKNSCCQGIWDGYCGGSCFRKCGKGCGTSCPLPKSKGHGCALGGRWHAGFGGCGTGKGCGVTCGKGGCGMMSYSKGGYGMVHHGFGGKGGWSFGAKGGCGGCGHFACGGACGCAACGHGRVGLFDWMHFGHGKGYRSHGKGHAFSAGGCSSCGGGVKGWPTQTHDYHSVPAHAAPVPADPTPSVIDAPTPTPTPAPTLQAPLPAPVDVEATPTSDHSAQWQRYPYGVRVMYSGF